MNDTTGFSECQIDGNSKLKTQKSKPQRKSKIWKYKLTTEKNGIITIHSRPVSRYGVNSGGNPATGIYLAGLPKQILAVVYPERDRRTRVTSIFNSEIKSNSHTA
jgi:hypothetical protein